MNSSTEVASSVNDSFNPNSRGRSLGTWTETQARLWLVQRGDRIILSQFETPFAEIDILALRPSGQLLLCEVKSSFWPDGEGLGLGPKQKLRLSRAAAWVSSETNRDVEIILLGRSTQSGHFDEVPIF